MGLGGLMTAWQRQTKDFGHSEGDKYSCLIIDNRGIGSSDKPAMRYSTSEMAKDIAEILNHIGWTAERSLNVIGISMGGMISQELVSRSAFNSITVLTCLQAMLIPSRIASLILVSTAARLVNTIGFVENLRNRINLFIPKSIDKQIANAKANMYTASYLASPDTVEHVKQPFPTSGDRFAAGELAKRKNAAAFPKTGFIAQALAAGWHHKSPQQLQQLANTVGRDRIMVIHGTDDHMITFPHAEVLARELSSGGEKVRSEFFPGQGHIIPAEKRKEFHNLITEMVEHGYSG